MNASVPEMAYTGWEKEGGGSRADQDWKEGLRAGSSAPSGRRRPPVPGSFAADLNLPTFVLPALVGVRAAFDSDFLPLSAYRATHHHSIA